MNALELGLGAVLGGMTVRGVAGEVIDHAGERGLVDLRAGDGAIIDPDDLLEAGIAAGSGEVLATRLLDLRAAGVGVAAVTPAAAGDEGTEKERT